MVTLQNGTNMNGEHWKFKCIKKTEDEEIKWENEKYCYVFSVVGEKSTICLVLKYYCMEMNI